MCGKYPISAIYVRSSDTLMPPKDNGAGAIPDAALLLYLHGIGVMLKRAQGLIKLGELDMNNACLEWRQHCGVLIG